MTAFLCIGAAHWDLIAQADGALGRGMDLPGRIAERPGGVAGNVARALAAAGVRTALLSAVGRDGAGEALVAALAAAGIDCTHVLKLEAPTGRYLAVQDRDGELFAAVADCRALERAGTALLASLRERRIAELSREDTAVIDGNLPPDVIEACLAAPALAVARLAVVAASPAKAACLAPALGDARVTLYLNRREAEALAGAAFPAARAAAVALAATGIAGAVVTDGAAPASAASPAGVVTLLPPRAEGVSATGAGDAFLAAHLLARAQGQAARAALAAALAASRRHMAQNRIFG